MLDVLYAAQQRSGRQGLGCSGQALPLRRGWHPSLWPRARRASVATGGSDAVLTCLNAKGRVTSVELVTLLELAELF